MDSKRDKIIASYEWHNDDDISTERLLAMVADDCGCDVSRVADLISRQAAIEALLDHVNIPTQAQREYAVEIFENIPPVEPKPPVDLKPTETPLVFGENAEFEFATMCCEDCISRADIEYHTQLEARGNGQYEEVEVAYKSDIESLPSVEPIAKNATPTDEVVDFNNMISAGGRIRNLPPVTPKEQQEHGRLIDADKLLQELFIVDEEEWTTPEIRTIFENAPPVEPKQPEIIRCKNCRHDNNCEIQYAAQAGSEFFCGAAEQI